MASIRRINVQCPNCRQPINTQIDAIIDPAQDPNAKTRLLSGRANTIQCPNCGSPVTVAAPLLYHDGSKDLLITFVPMELGLPKDAQEKAVGDLMRELMTRIPQNQMRGYLFNPRSSLTMQGLIDQVLQADGVTPEMMEAQKTRARLVETLLQTPEESLDAFIQQIDAQIDAPFFQLMTMMAQRVAQDGRPDMAQQIVMVQQRVAELSTFGGELLAASQRQEEIVREVAAQINELGQGATREDFLALAIQFAALDDPQEGQQHLEALVGLARPAFDAPFFQQLKLKTGQAPADERDMLEALEEILTALIDAVDQQSQADMQNIIGFLQAALQHPDPAAFLQANAGMIDDTVLSVLVTNIEQAQQQGNAAAAARLKEIYDTAIGVLQSAMPPELRFVNELLSAPSLDDARAMMNDEGRTYGGNLIATIDAIGQVLSSRGESALLDRLQILRAEAEQMFAG